MVKVRMNTADVAAEIKCLRRLIGMRCSNVYDITPKAYLFKLMNSSGITESGESEKVLLLMESGVRLHTTEYVRDKSTTPSGFTLKLRKHIRTRRLEDVRQLGYDRVIVFQFGLGNNAHFVILELYAQGNIILTDSEYTVLTLLRSHRDDAKGFAIMSRHRYPIEACRVFERTSFTKLQTTLTCSTASLSVDFLEVVEGGANEKFSDSIRKVNDGIQAKKVTLKTVLGESLGYGPALSEHIILDAGLLPSMKIGSESNSSIDDGMIEVLAQAVGRFEDWLADVVSGDRVPEGYIFMQNKASGKKETVPSQIYDEFSPILLNQFKSREVVEMANFDAALDEFYSKIESQKSEQQQKAREGSAIQKLSKIRLDQESRVHTLKKEVEHCVKMAELIEYNLDDVDAAILAVRVALASGMDWVDLARMVKEEKKSGNPVAGLIDKLHLERNCITLLLSNNLDEMDEDEKTQPADKVEVDLVLSAHANACRWFEQKKRQENKQEKTITAHEKAFKAAERKTRFQLSQEKAVAAISHMRKVHWFEKFNWFISNENYLVISGRDAQQNEMIVKRYMSKGDLYVHADLHGASSTVIKNNKPENPVPPLTLNQAGCFTVCHSQAWDAKIVTSAWWVYPHQVSKTAPTGEYLTVGSFMIRGKKNFLPPHPLVMGFGMLFRLDESSLGLHLNERRVRGEEEGVHDIEERVSVKENMDPGSEGEISSEESADKSENLSLDSNLSTVDSKLKSENDSGAGHACIDPCSSNRKSIEKCGDILQENGTTPNDVNVVNGFDLLKSEKSAPSKLEVLMDQALGLGSAKVSEKTYGLDNVQDTKTVDHDSEERKSTLGNKTRLSKAERQRLKKGQNADITNGQQESKELDENHLSGPRENRGAENPKPPSGKISRGQRGKLKKIKEKYAEQDDEERAIRMALLASAGKAQKAEKELLQDKSGSPSKKPGSVTGQEDITKICYKCKRAGHLSRDCRGLVDGIGEAKVVPNKHVDGESIPTADVENAASDEVVSMTFEEDDIHEIGEEEKEKLNDLDYLTGNPLQNDILHYAVPVCGPYNALQAYKYRVKIMPGTAKKGKAAKTVMNLFSHMPDATSREKELMKACTEPELVAAMVGNVKIAAAGLTMLKQKQKKGKKGSKVES